MSKATPAANTLCPHGSLGQSHGLKSGLWALVPTAPPPETQNIYDHLHDRGRSAIHVEKCQKTNSQQVREGQVDRQLRDPSSVSPETEAVRPFQVRRKGFPGMSFSNHHRLRKRCPQLRSQTSLSKLHSLRCWPTAMPRKQKEGLPILNLPGTRYPKQAKAGSVLAPQEFLGSWR